MQCQEFEPWGAGDIFGHGAACCRALLSFTAGYMLYFSSMSGLVAHCPAAICLELFKSVNTHVEHVTHNEQLGFPPDCRRRWIQKRLLKHFSTCLRCFLLFHHYILERTLTLLLHCIHLLLNRLKFYKNMRYKLLFSRISNIFVLMTTSSREFAVFTHWADHYWASAGPRFTRSVGWDGLLKVGMFRMTWGWCPLRSLPRRQRLLWAQPSVSPIWLIRSLGRSRETADWWII